jgi:hypothetical protein
MMATEKRLIDANAYDATLKNREETLVEYSGSLSGAIKGCRALLAEESTVDAVVVVRCKECKHSRTPGNTSIRYGLPGTVTCANPNSPCHYRHTKGEDYCPYGQRREHD